MRTLKLSISPPMCDSMSSFIFRKIFYEFYDQKDNFIVQYTRRQNKEKMPECRVSGWGILTFLNANWTNRLFYSNIY